MFPEAQVRRCSVEQLLSTTVQIGLFDTGGARRLATATLPIREAVCFDPRVHRSFSGAQAHVVRVITI